MDRILRWTDLEKIGVISIIINTLGLLYLNPTNIYDILYLNPSIIISIVILGIYSYKSSNLIPGLFTGIVFVIASILSSSSYQFLLSFKELPSPVFGGDYYAQLGQINYVNRTLDIFGNQYYEGKLFSYNPLYSWLVVITMRLMNIDGISAMKLLSSILIYSTIIWYYISLRLGGSYGVAMLVFIVASSLTPVILKYTDFTISIVSPIVLYLILKRNYALAILLSTISHFLLLLYVLIFISYDIIRRLMDQEKLNNIFKDVIPILFLLPLGLYMIYRLDMFNEYFPRNRLDFPVYSNSEGMLFLYTKYIPEWMMSKIWVILAYLYSLYKDRKLYEFDHYIILTSVLILISPILDLFLFNTVPTYTTSLVLTPLILLSIPYRKSEYSMLLVLFILAQLHLTYESYTSSFTNLKKYSLTLTDLFPEYAEAIRIISEDPGVILSNKPIAFALNAYTGNNVVATRWAQSFHLPFLNFSNRDLDAAIILYSSNRSLAQELLNKYRVKYIVIDLNRFFASEFSSTIPNIKHLSRYEYRQYIRDPLICLECKSELDANRILYITADGWLDPAIREFYIKTFRVYIIDYRNYERIKIDSNYKLIYQNGSLYVYKLQ